MKKLIMLLIFSISSLFGYSDTCGTNSDINIDTEKYFTNNGWAKPLNRNNLTTDVAYNYDSSIYYCRVNYEFRHGAVDIDASLGEKVYPIDDGKIVAFYRDNNSENKNISIIYIKHTTSTGKEFLGIYGHVYLKSELDVGSDVIKGKDIGVIKKFNNTHIHFSIGTNINLHNTNKWGGIKDGIVNPLEFLETNQNDTSTTNSIAGIFDGAGSIISANEQGAGKNFDIAKMHPHPGTGSTVVFQWLYDADSCSQLDIRSEYDIGDVIIRSKVWDKHLTKKAIKVKLNDGMPITIKRPDNTKVWTTFAITTTKPLEFGNRIIAECKTSNDIFEQGNAVNVDTDLVDVTYDYFWTGTGSIISSANREFNPPYGLTADLAVTFKDYNSLTSFQWLKQGSCKKLKISTNGSSSINSVHIKKWDVENWGESKCNSLPCTLSPSLNEYYVIKVKSSPNAISSGSLYAECVQ